MRLLLILCFCFSLFDIYAQKHAEIEFSKTEYIIESNNSATVKYIVKARVLNEKGSVQGGILDYSDKFRKVTSASMSVYDQFGKRIEKYSKKDARHYNFNNSYSIDDSKRFVLFPSTQNYPYTVEYSYEVRYNGLIAFPRWYPLVNNWVSIDRSELSVMVRPEANILVKSMNGLQEPTEQVDSDYKVYSWVIENLEPIEPKPYARSLYESQPFVYIVPKTFELAGNSGSFRDWTSFGNWFYELNQNLGELTPATKQKLDLIKKSTSSNEEVIKKTFTFMQDRTRYISIQLGIGGLKSLPIDYVDQKGYGDCKALSTYMKAMLEYNGINSNYILVNAGAIEPDIMKEIPSYQFNHVFLGVPSDSDTILLECTSQSSPINYIGTFTDDRYVLWVEKDASHIIRTPKSTPAQNLSSTKANIVLANDGSARIELNMEKRGTHFRQTFQYEVMDAKDLERMHYKRFPLRDYAVNEFSFDADKKSISLFENYDLSVNNFAKITGNRIVLKAGFLSDVNAISSSYDETGSIVVRRGGLNISDYTIELPENYNVTYKSEPIEISNDYGKYSLDIQSEDGKLLIRREFLLEDGVYNGDQIDGFKEFFDDVRKSDNSKILLMSKT